MTFLQRFGSALNLNPHLHAVIPDGLLVHEDVDALTVTVAQRLTDRLAADAADRSDYLDPDLAALCETLFWSQNPPPGTRDLPRLPDGKVVYKLRRPWPHAGGPTHLVLDPIAFAVMAYSPTAARDCSGAIGGRGVASVDSRRYRVCN